MVIELLFDVEELIGIVFLDLCILFDLCEVIVCIVDGFEFDEFKLLYGLFLVIGWVWLYGYLLGILVNVCGVLFSEEL